MKTTQSLFFWLAAALVFAAPLMAMGGSAGASSAQTSASEEMTQAQKELNQAAAEFSGEAQAKGQQTRQTPLSEALGAPQAQSQDTGGQTDPRNQALQGSPSTGYAGTWTDPATGDIMTSVIAPAPQPSQQQNYPMIIEPQVSGGSYYGGQSWQQWPTSPDNPGYPPRHGQSGYGQPPQQHYPGWMPPYPGQPYPGFNPYPGMNYPPGWWAGQQPGPPQFNPNYRPLTPPQGQPGQNMGPTQGWNGASQPGPNPGQGWNPPAQNPGQTNPGSLWRPGMGQPQGGLSPAPPMQQLPMAPAGGTWNNSPLTPRPPQGGMFGGRSSF